MSFFNGQRKRIILDRETVQISRLRDFQFTFSNICFRFGLHWRVDVQNRVIPEGYAIFDLPGFFIQIGVDLYERMNDPKYLIK